MGSIVVRAGRKTRPTRTLPQDDTFLSAEADSGGGLAVAPPVGHVSLEGVHGTVELPDHQAGFWRQWWAFSGPAILVSVGYMDPGNWGTDLQGGAQYKYGLLWVVGMASLMAIFMQVIAARLGVVTGKDLAQCCRDWYPRWTRWPNWLMCEVAIGVDVIWLSLVRFALYSLLLFSFDLKSVTIFNHVKATSMSLTEPDLWISHIRLFSKTHVPGYKGV